MPTIDAHQSKIAILEMVKKAGVFQAVTDHQHKMLAKFVKAGLAKVSPGHRYELTAAGVKMLEVGK